MIDRQNLIRYSVGILASICLFAIINYFDFVRPHGIVDGIYRHGIPFTFYRHGGYQGERTHVWIGLFGDLAIAIASGIAIANIWTNFTIPKVRTDETKSKLLR